MVLSVVNHAYTSAKHDHGTRWLDEVEEGYSLEARIRVRLTPKASRDEIVGWQDGLLRVRVCAPPVDGKANDALVRLLAKALGVPKSAVGVVSGAKSREKLIGVGGIDSDEAAARLGGAGAG